MKKAYILSFFRRKKKEEGETVRDRISMRLYFIGNGDLVRVDIRYALARVGKECAVIQRGQISITFLILTMSRDVDRKVGGVAREN